LAPRRSNRTAVSRCGKVRARSPAVRDLGALIGGCVDGGAFWPHGEADFSRPPVRQLERLPHVELEHAKAPAQVLQRPDDRVLHLRRGPLAELVMTYIRLQGRGDEGGGLAMGLLSVLLGVL